MTELARVESQLILTCPLRVLVRPFSGCPFAHYAYPYISIPRSYGGTGAIPALDPRLQSTAAKTETVPRGLFP